jgi:hypothetical protein
VVDIALVVHMAVEVAAAHNPAVGHNRVRHMAVVQVVRSLDSYMLSILISRRTSRNKPQSMPFLWLKHAYIFGGGA